MTYTFNKSNNKLIERIIDDNYIQLNHLSLDQGDNIPEHITDSNVYLIIVKGHMKLILDLQNTCNHSEGSIINIPYNINIYTFERGTGILDFFVVKSQIPENLKVN
ncbi:hypothetical protein [Methanohalobium sp.]|uniref:hypothetical protein n=1 Tax=Methanohalobium sp. TaxID=2837493 RepID=UPI0025FA827C|nr:hypothetical protein [Methanohalobium sp.]